MKNKEYGTGSTQVTERPGERSERAGGQSARKPDVNSEEMMKKMAAAGTPGPAHKALEPLVGNWKAEVKCWMDPDGPPSVSQATAKTSWTLNGHYLEEEFHGQMMGKSFNGRCLLGYDNTKQVDANPYAHP